MKLVFTLLVMLVFAGMAISGGHYWPSHYTLIKGLAVVANGLVFSAYLMARRGGGRG